MSVGNTRERIKTAALKRFARHGFAATSIADIESAAGLAPRAGTFYRHFESKQALFEELARERLTESPDEFDFPGLAALPDTRSALLQIARRFELAAERQRPYLRLIEELRLTKAGRAFEAHSNRQMLRALMGWVATRPAGAGLQQAELASLAVEVFGSWLFYLGKRQQGIELDELDGTLLRERWSERWTGILDTEHGFPARGVRPVSR